MLKCNEKASNFMILNLIMSIKKRKIAGKLLALFSIASFGFFFAHFFMPIN